MKIKYFWVPAFVLILLLSGVIGMNTHYKKKIAVLHVDIADMTAEKDKLIDSVKKSKAENNKLKNKIKELLTSENKSELHITNYILTNYKKVPPVLAKKIAKVALEKSAEHNVSFHVIVAVMEVESNFNPFSVSKLKKDPARGLMQVRYNVWKETLGMKSAYELHSVSGGIDAGTRVLRKYLDETKNNLDQTLYKYVGKDKIYVRLVYAKMGKFTAFTSVN